MDEKSEAKKLLRKHVGSIKGSIPDISKDKLWNSFVETMYEEGTRESRMRAALDDGLLIYCKKGNGFCNKECKEFSVCWS